MCYAAKVHTRAPFVADENWFNSLFNAGFGMNTNMGRCLLSDQGSGFCVTGKIEAGFIQTGDRVLAMPPNETCTAKGDAPDVFLSACCILNVHLDC